MRLSLTGNWRPLLFSTETLPGAVALSIDDGPTAETTPQLLALLKQYDARATFFLSGVRAVEHPEIIEQLVSDGHQIFAHGWDHIRLFAKGGGDKIDRESIAAMEACENLLRRFRPTPSPYLIRLPYGYSHRNLRAHRALNRWQPGCQIAHWGVSFEDHTIAPRCNDFADVQSECREAVERTLSSHKLSGAILLCHDLPFDVEGPLQAHVTPVLMETILAALQQRGLQAVPIPPRRRHSLLSLFVLN